MANNSLASASSSDSGYSSASDEPVSPPVTIRRPLDPPMLHNNALAVVPVSPAPDLAGPLGSPYHIATPVIITPVDRRSTRELVHIGRIRRVRHRRASHAILNSIRRRLSLATAGEHRAHLEQIATPVPTPRTRHTAIELEAVDEFQTILSAALDTLEPVFAPPSTTIPSESTTGARLREHNRLEALEVSRDVLERDEASMAEIQNALALLEGSMGQMSAETDIIEQYLDEFEAEKREKLTRWARIEEIMKLIREG
ncbi:unnamed protein product [Caenorhabditis sp. 36 PRJEB53466]|nr:unnamed protein product [Caenorhabditis sp. 36 PRJEB53466]